MNNLTEDNFVENDSNGVYYTELTVNDNIDTDRKYLNHKIHKLFQNESAYKLGAHMPICFHDESNQMSAIVCKIAQYQAKSLLNNTNLMIEFGHLFINEYETNLSYLDKTDKQKSLFSKCYDLKDTELNNNNSFSVLEYAANIEKQRQPLFDGLYTNVKRCINTFSTEELTAIHSSVYEVKIYIYTIRNIYIYIYLNMYFSYINFILIFICHSDIVSYMWSTSSIVFHKT